MHNMIGTSKIFFWLLYHKPHFSGLCWLAPKVSFQVIAIAIFSHNHQTCWRGPTYTPYLSLSFDRQRHSNHSHSPNKNILLSQHLINCQRSIVWVSQTRNVSFYRSFPGVPTVLRDVSGVCLNASCKTALELFNYSHTCSLIQTSQLCISL